MSSALYFPIINYKYVRKEKIPELTGKLFAQEDVDNVLSYIEAQVEGFSKKKSLDSFLQRFTYFFPLLFSAGIITITVCSILATILGVLIGLAVIGASLLFLFLLTVVTVRLRRVDSTYKTKIEKLLIENNKFIEKTGAQWKVGDGNILELIFKEEWEFDDYYDDEEEEDNHAFK